MFDGARAPDLEGAIVRCVIVADDGGEVTHTVVLAVRRGSLQHFDRDGAGVDVAATAR